MKNIITLSLALWLTACSSDKVEQVAADSEQAVANEFTDIQRQ